MDILKSLEWRYAVKKFDDQKKISQELITQVQKGLVLSASSFGVQPWNFIFISNYEIKNQILSIAFNQTQIIDCSHLIVLCRKDQFGETQIDEFTKDFSKKQNISENNQSMQAYFNLIKKTLLGYSKDKMDRFQTEQVYLALGNLLTLCAHLKIDSCPIAGFLPVKLDELLKLKEKNLKSVVLCPIGYRSPEDTYANKPKVRFDKNKIITVID